MDKRQYWDGSDQRMVHFRPMVAWSFSLSFITEMPLTKFEQDLSHLRKKISVATILDALSKFWLSITNKSGQEEKLWDCLKATVLKQWLSNFVGHGFRPQRGSLQNLGPFGRLFIFLKFPPCKVRFSDLYPDLLYKCRAKIPTLTDSAGHNFHRIFKVSMPKRPWERAFS